MKKYFLLLLFPFSLFAQNTPLVRVDNYTALRALAIPTVNNRMAAIVSGYAGPVAEGGSIFIYDSASAVADDDDIYVKPDSTTGRWIKILKTGAGGGGNVSTDTIWDAKGDLAVGTGPNSAQKLTVGANDTILVADSAQTTGTKWLAITGFEAALEAVLDLQDLQGAVNDAQVPNNITVDLATLASTVTVVDSSDSTSYPLIVDSPTGNLPPKTDAALTYDASTGILGATGFSSNGAGAGSLELDDADNSNSVTIKAHPTTTADYSWLFPAAGFTGYIQGTLSGSDMQMSRVEFGNGILGSDGSNNPVDIDSEPELENALGGLDVVTVTTDDISSANLATLVSDETGSGLAVFNNSPTFVDDFNLHAAGVRFTGDGDGAVTLLGLGDGSDEDLTINLDDTANNIVFSSSTGVTNITFTSINLTVPAAVYDATAWNGNNTVPTRDDVRDALEAFADVDDVAVAGSWNGSLNATTKNTLHDYFVLMDSDLDGLVNALDSTFTFSGFSISGDGDGAVTLLGAGDGADEDLTINLDDTANNAIITTSTGLTNITLTAINLTVPAAAYDATAWNGNNAAPTRDDVRDKIEDVIDGQVWTGVHDFGGATSTEIVNGNNPTVDAAGEIAVDSNDNSIRIYGSAARVVPTIYTASVTIFDPDGIQPTSDALPILAVESTWAPAGITIVDIYLKTDASSTYSINLEEWTSPTDGAPTTIEAVATSASIEAEDDGTLSDGSIAAGSIVFVDLPSTAVNWIQVSFTYTINSNN